MILLFQFVMHGFLWCMKVCQYWLERTSYDAISLKPHSKRLQAWTVCGSRHRGNVLFHGFYQQFREMNTNVARVSLCLFLERIFLNQEVSSLWHSAISSLHIRNRILSKQNPQNYLKFWTTFGIFSLWRVRNAKLLTPGQLLGNPWNLWG